MNLMKLRLFGFCVIYCGSVDNCGRYLIMVFMLVVCVK